MLPLLRLTGDGAEHTLVATVQAVSDDFPVTPEERAQPRPHANRTVIYNRVSWATSYLRYAAC
ncbi:MAG: winged helix-turn-helix domain-containing protein [Candidatus Limnocylindrales bacterium]